MVQISCWNSSYHIFKEGERSAAEVQKGLFPVVYALQENFLEVSLSIFMYNLLATI